MAVGVKQRDRRIAGRSQLPPGTALEVL